MYAHHFGLSQDPFSIAPDPRYLFMSERHREALAHLLFGVGGPEGRGTGGGFVLLTGDVGTGKTTICRCFLEQIPATCNVAYVFNPKLTVAELLQSICAEFGVPIEQTASASPSTKDYIDALNRFLLDSHAAGRSSVLVIDEAQNLAPEVLEQLRLLTNLETSECKLLQIVLIGQPELRKMLMRPDLEQLAQRVIARFHLDALTAPETEQYVAHRLAVAGLTGATPFDGRALQEIHRLSRGVPRRINLLCGRALLGAWAHGLPRVDRKIVNKAATEIFGTAPGVSRFPRRALAAALLGGVLLLVGGSVAAYLMWPQSESRTAQERVVAKPATEGTLRAPEVAPTAAAPAAAPDSTQASAASERALPPSSSSAAPNPSRQSEPAALEDIDALLPRFARPLDDVWRDLAAVWKLPSAEGEPCAAAAAQQLQCYRTVSLTLPALRQLGRPGIVTLRGEGGSPLYALLVGLNEQAAWLQTPDGVHKVGLVALDRRWRGEFATYWRPPAGYAPDLPDGATGPAIDELTDKLDVLDGKAGRASASTRPVLDNALRARVRAFQRAQGLKADGQPGPMTFMHLDAATDAAQPRLSLGAR